MDRHGHDPSAPPPPPHHHHLNHHQQHQFHHHSLSHHQFHHQQSSPAAAPPPPRQQQQQQGLMIPTNTNTSYSLNQNIPNSTSPQIIIPISSSSMIPAPNPRYPFNNTTSQQKPQPSMPLAPVEGSGSFDSPYSGGFSGGGGDGGGSGGGDQGKKKRGRPRKYSPPDGGSNVALRLAPTTNNVGRGEVCETPDGQGKKHRGRPPGSGKKQLDALGNCGVGFTPHVILVEAGEDIGAKILAFSQQGPRTVCILSANGSISNVTLRQPALSAGTVTYEGKFDIISLSGSFLLSENDSSHIKTGGLSISIAGTDGRVLGGGVAGTLRAATPVQIVVGSFIADGKKPKYMPSVPESRMLTFSALAPADSPPSHEVSGGSSEDDGDSPINGTMGGPSPFNNFSQQGHNVHMYQGRANSNAKMHPH